LDPVKKSYLKEARNFFIWGKAVGTPGELVKFIGKEREKSKGRDALGIRCLHEEEKSGARHQARAKARGPRGGQLKGKKKKAE